MFKKIIIYFSILFTGGSANKRWTERFKAFEKIFLFKITQMTWIDNEFLFTYVYDFYLF
jgi:hypothetical protein